MKTYDGEDYLESCLVSVLIFYNSYTSFPTFANLSNGQIGDEYIKALYKFESLMFPTIVSRHSCSSFFQSHFQMMPGWFYNLEHPIRQLLRKSHFILKRCNGFAELRVTWTQ